MQILLTCGVQRKAELVYLAGAELDYLSFLGEQLDQLGVLLEDVADADGSGRVGPPGVGDVRQRGGLPRRPEAGASGARVRLRLRLRPRVRVQATERRSGSGGRGGHGG